MYTLVCDGTAEASYRFIDKFQFSSRLVASKIRGDSSPGNAFFRRVSKCDYEEGIGCKSNSDSRETRLQTRRGQRRSPGNKITSSIVRK